IILGGALIKYEEMNKNLDLVYSVGRWLKKAGNDEENASKLKVLWDFTVSSKKVRAGLWRC
ncbi:MAG: hypothetical protein ABL859_10080, partial [Methylotenera sp.]